MKKILVPVLFVLLVLGIGTVAKADMRYGPQVVEDATVAAPNTLEISGIYSGASNKIEVGPAPGVTIIKPVGPGGEVAPDPDPIKVKVDVTGFTGVMTYGLGRSFDIGVSVPYVSQTSADTTYIPTASGLSDTTVKVKVGSGYVSGSVSAILPTGVSALSMKDNGTDYALGLAFSPFGTETRQVARLHMNVGQTFWNSSSVTDRSSTNYGMAIEWCWPRSGNTTIECAGSTMKDQGGNTPLDLYWGFKIDASRHFQILGLVDFGLSKASNLGQYGLGYGLGLKWMI